MRKVLFISFLVFWCVKINAQEIIYSGGLSQSNIYELIVGTTLVKANYKRHVYYDTDNKTFSYTKKFGNGDSHGSSYGYIIPSNIKKIAKGCFANSKLDIIFFREGQNIEFADGAFDGYAGNFYIGYNVIESDGPSNVRGLSNEESVGGTEEVGRYNINGVKVQESANGKVQIILYSDGSTKKIIE